MVAWGADREGKRLWVVSSGVVRGGRIAIVKRIMSRFACDRRIFKRNFCVMRLLMGQLDGSYSQVPIVVSRHLVSMARSYHKRCLVISNRFESCGHRRRAGGELILSIFTERVRFVRRRPSKTEAGRVLLRKCVYGHPICEGAPLKERVTSVLLTIGEPCNGSSCVPYVY